MTNELTRDQIISKVNDVMHKGFEIPLENLKPSTTLFEDLKLDSLDAVDMLVHLEEKFGAKIEGERLMTIRTMQDIYDLVSEISSEPAHFNPAVLAGISAAEEIQISH